MRPKTHLACKASAVDDAQARHGMSRQWISGKSGGLLLVAGAYALGGGGMVAWLAFLIHGPVLRSGSGLGHAGALLMDAGLCLFFFLQHSIMVRRGFRIWLARTVRAEFHGALYATFSGACLLVLVLTWQPVNPPLWSPVPWIRWTMTGVFFAAGAGAYWGTRALGGFDGLGVKPALGAVGGKRDDAPMELSVRGPYRWVRHPLYLFSLTLIWAGPVFTPDRLLHNSLWSVWIIIAAGLEERDLVACFGDAYRSYRKSVPMLLPKSIRPLAPEGKSASRRVP